MGLGAGIKAGKAFVEFILSDKKLDGQLGRIAGRLQQVGTIGLAATAPIIAGFTAAALTFASVGSELNDMAGRTGQSVQSLSELEFAAQQAGTDMGVVEGAFKELQSKGIDPIHFDEIAADIAAIEDPTQRAQRAMEIFGKRTGTLLLPLLSQLPRLRQHAQALGVTLSDENAAAADELGDSLEVAKLQLEAMAIQIGAAIAGPLTEFLHWSQGVLSATIQWIKENPRLVRTIAAVTLGIAAASAAAATFGMILTIITLHPIITALTLIAGLVLGVAAYFGLASDAAGDFKSSLDSVKMPGAKAGSPFAAQGNQVQSQLSSALAGRAVIPVTNAATASAPPRPARDYGAEIAKWTKQTADGIEELVRLAKFNPLNASGALLNAILP